MTIKELMEQVHQQGYMAALYGFTVSAFKPISKNILSFTVSEARENDLRSCGRIAQPETGSKERTPPFGSVLPYVLKICNYLRAPPSTAAVFADRSSHRFSLANSSFCGRMISYPSSWLSLKVREDVLSPRM